MPGPKEVGSVLAGIPSGLDRHNRGGVYSGLVCPTGNVGDGQGLHGRDRGLIADDNGVAKRKCANVGPNKNRSGEHVEIKYGRSQQRGRGCDSDAGKESSAIGFHEVSPYRLVKRGWSESANVGCSWRGPKNIFMSSP